MPLGGNGASQELGSPFRLRYKILPNRNQMGNISSASVVVAGPGSSKRFTKSTHLVVPTVAAATTFSPAQAVSSQAGNFYGFSLLSAGSRNPSLHGCGFLGRCPGLERLKIQGSSLFIQYPCAFFSLFSHSFLPHLLSHNLRAGIVCYAHYPA